MIAVNTNVSSLFAQRALGKNSFDLQKSIEKLSTGYKINRAADDAAGLTISEKLTSTVKGLEKAKQNVGDGISVIQTAEGALGIIQDNLQRIRELVVQGKNGTNGTNEADALQREINERVSTIDAISQATKFNGKTLIYSNTASTDDITIQYGADNAQTSNITFRAGQTANTGIDIDITSTLAGNSSDYGTLVEGTTASSGFALNRIHLGVSSMSVNSVLGTSGGTTSNVTVTLTDMDTVIKNVSRMRSYLGAMQNSFESRLDFIDVAAENNSAARSRVRDVDVAHESSVMLKNQILQQSAATMLTQANSSSQLALNLLP
jgi:flagellin